MFTPLAEVRDGQVDPERRASHRAQAAPGPDEDVAAELEDFADRAQARGGFGRGGGIPRRAAVLTPEPGCHAQRLLAAARATRDAGALDAALGLLVAVEAGPLDALRTAEVEQLRGQIAFDRRRVSDAAQRASREVVIANSRGPETLRSAVAALGTGVSAGTVGEAAAAGIVAIAVPWPSVPAAVTGLRWDGQTVIDATNAWNVDLGGRTSSEIVADLVPGARLGARKAANTLPANVLGADTQAEGGRWVIFLSGDDAPARPRSSSCSTPPASSRSTSANW